MGIRSQWRWNRRKRGNHSGHADFQDKAQALIDKHSALFSCNQIWRPRIATTEEQLYQPKIKANLHERVSDWIAVLKASPSLSTHDTELLSSLEKIQRQIDTANFVLENDLPSRVRGEQRIQGNIIALPELNLPLSRAQLIMILHELLHVADNMERPLLGFQSMFYTVECSQEPSSLMPTDSGVMLDSLKLPASGENSERVTLTNEDSPYLAGEEESGFYFAAHNSVNSDRIGEVRAFIFMAQLHLFWLKQDNLFSDQDIQNLYSQDSAVRLKASKKLQDDIFLLYAYDHEKTKAELSNANNAVLTTLAYLNVAPSKNANNEYPFDAEEYFVLGTQGIYEYVINLYNTGELQQ